MTAGSEQPRPGREEVRFRSGDGECAAWLYRPAGSEDSPADAPAPCVILAHGFGTTREARLDAYAERFAAAGYAALVFDYRHFGASDGTPRGLLSIPRQHDDYRAAVAFARRLDRVDPERIVLWGTSFSGGHVVAVAAGDPTIAAVISQIPHLDGLATLRAAGPAAALRLAAAGLRDLAGAALGRGPSMLPVVGPPGSTAAMTTPDALAGYRRLYGDPQRPPGEVVARIVLRVGTYSPGRRASRVARPLLIQVAGDDAITPPAPARRAAARAPRGELREYPGVGHFDAYFGASFERFVADQLEFLGRHVPAARAGAEQVPNSV